MDGSLFRKESLKKISSPEELNDYIKISSPGLWLVIAAAAAVVMTLFLWAVLGSVSSTEKLTGVAQNGVVKCYVADVSDITASCSASVGGVECTVRSVSDVPISRSAAEEDCGGDEYTVWLLKLSDWNYVVELDAPGVADGTVQVTVFLSKVRPISFIFG